MSATATPPAPSAASGTPAVTLVQFAETTDPSAAAEREQELTQQVREDAGMAALIGADGAAAFSALDG